MRSFIFISTLLFSFTIYTQAQEFERYKKLTDTSISSSNLGFTKNIQVTVPIEWQDGVQQEFPLVIIFDMQNERSYTYMLRTIDYLTSNEQMPSCVIVGVESTEEHRYRETLFKISDEKGLAKENEQFIFNELIPLAEQKYKASKFRLLVGHSRYGFFTSGLLFSRIDELNAIISISPVFKQKNINFTDSLAQLPSNLTFTRYYRYGIGNDYPEEFQRMDSVSGIRKIPQLNIKGNLYKEADHNATPGLTIPGALYDVFEKWAETQSVYISNEQLDLGVLDSLNRRIQSHYGYPLAFSLGILNGKGWFFYSIENYEKAIEAWEQTLKYYPNFAEAYLFIMDCEMKLKRDTSATKNKFETSLLKSAFYTEEERKELLQEYEQMK